MIRKADLHLPAKGRGRIILAASASRAGRNWTHGTARQERSLKHRAARLERAQFLFAGWRSGVSSGKVGA